jgi:hypothetical protein
LTIECIDYNVLKDKPLGKCKVDLHTLATGPMDHAMKLRDDNDEEVGDVFFRVVMDQIIDQMTCILSNIRIADWVRDARVLASSRVSVRVRYSDDQASKYTETSAVYATSASPSWSQVVRARIPQVSTSELLDDDGAICVSLMLDDKTEIASSRIPVLKYYTPAQTTPTNLAETMVNGSLQPVGSFRGQLMFADGPYFRQLPLPEAGSGLTCVHTDAGVYAPVRQLPGFIVPRGIVHGSDPAAPELPAHISSTIHQSDYDIQRAGKQYNAPDTKHNGYRPQQHAGAARVSSSTQPMPLRFNSQSSHTGAQQAIKPKPRPAVADDANVRMYICIFVLRE